MSFCSFRPRQRHHIHWSYVVPGGTNDTSTTRRTCPWPFWLPLRFSSSSCFACSTFPANLKSRPSFAGTSNFSTGSSNSLLNSTNRKYILPVADLLLLSFPPTQYLSFNLSNSSSVYWFLLQRQIDFLWLLQPRRSNQNNTNIVRLTWLYLCNDWQTFTISHEIHNYKKLVKFMCCKFWYNLKIYLIPTVRNRSLST